MSITINDFIPSTRIENDDTINKVLSFVTKINNIYNISRYSCGCFYTNWNTDKPTPSIIGREQMLEFIL